jgi:hypothetical protein
MKSSVYRNNLFIMLGLSAVLVALCFLLIPSEGELMMFYRILGIAVSIYPLFAGLFGEGPLVRSLFPLQILVNDAGEIAEDLTRDYRTVWLHELRAKKLHIEWLPDSFRLFGRLDAVTNNPKIQHFGLDLKIKPEGTPEGFLKLREKLGGNWGDIEEKAETFLYQLKHACSRQIAELYDPTQPEQQKRFQEVVREFLSPKLADWGLVLESARFSMSV